MTRGRLCRGLFGVLACFACVGGAAAVACQPAGWGDAHSSVRLVSERDALVPGETAMVGLLFEIDEGWHIYQPSQNDTGLEPMVEWESDAGLSFGAIEWPAGHRFTQPGEILDHGYEGTVLLMLPVEVPSSAAVGSEVAISGRVEWLACDAAMCVPGRADVSLTLPVRSSAAASVEAGAFESARSSFGVPLTGASAAGLSIGWEGTTLVVSASGDGVLSFVPGAGCSRVRGLFASGASADGALRLEFGGEGEPVVGWIRFVGEGSGSAAGASGVWRVRTVVGKLP